MSVWCGIWTVPSHGPVTRSEVCGGVLGVDYGLGATGSEGSVLNETARGLPTEALLAAGGAADYKRLRLPTDCKLALAKGDVATLATPVPVTRRDCWTSRSSTVSLGAAMPWCR